MLVGDRTERVALLHFVARRRGGLGGFWRSFRCRRRDRLKRLRLERRRGLRCFGCRRLGRLRFRLCRLGRFRLCRRRRFWLCRLARFRLYRLGRLRLCRLGCGGLRYRRRRCRNWLRAFVSRRIEEERVLAHEAPGGPLQLDQQIEERLTYRLSRGEAQHAHIAAALQRKAHAVQCRIEFDSSLAEGFGRAELCVQAFFFAGLKRNDLDLGVERLAKGRKNRELAEPRRKNDQRRRKPQRSRQNRDGDRFTHPSPTLCS